MTSTLRKSEKEIRALFHRFHERPVFIFVDNDKLSRPGPRIFDVIATLSKKARALTSAGR